MWRIVSANLGSLVDVEERWSLTDAVAAHTVLDMREDAERQAAIQRGKP